MKLALDHLGIAARDLDPLVAMYEKLGFYITPKQQLMATNSDGSAIALGQQSAHIMFASLYLELTAVPGSLDEHHLKPYLQRFSGLHILALATDDVCSTRQVLQDKNIDAGVVQGAQRDIVYGLPGTAHFKWCQVMEKDFPHSLICYVQHLSAAKVFQNEVMVHPNGVTGISRVGFYSKTPALIREQMTGLNIKEGITFDITQRLEVFGDQPLAEHYLAEIEFCVESLASVQQLFDSRQIPYVLQGESVVISNQLAAGVGLLFCQQDNKSLNE